MGPLHSFACRPLVACTPRLILNQFRWLECLADSQAWHCGRYRPLCAVRRVATLPLVRLLHALYVAVISDLYASMMSDASAGNGHEILRSHRAMQVRTHAPVRACSCEGC